MTGPIRASLVDLCVWRRTGVNSGNCRRAVSPDNCPGCGRMPFHLAGRGRAWPCCLLSPRGLRAGHSPGGSSRVVQICGGSGAHPPCSPPQAGSSVQGHVTGSTQQHCSGLPVVFSAPHSTCRAHDCVLVPSNLVQNYRL